MAISAAAKSTHDQLFGDRVFDKSAGKLGVDQIDLLILHQALPSDFDKTLGAYRALETLLKNGKVRLDRITTLAGELGKRSIAVVGRRADGPIR